MGLENMGSAVESMGLAVENMGLAVESVGLALESIGLFVEGIKPFCGLKLSRSNGIKERNETIWPCYLFQNCYKT